MTRTARHTAYVLVVAAVLILAAASGAGRLMLAYILVAGVALTFLAEGRATRQPSAPTPRPTGRYEYEDDVWRMPRERR